MIDALLASQTFVYLAASAVALGTCGLIFVAMRAFLRLGQKDRSRIFGDYPNLIHGPQERPDQPESPRTEP